ncbi:MAG: cyclic phosphodiesterase-like [Candidatus Adlerbacteria bacterium]|nr:cyclic phosphodiesterase-like [Candidatus Adlerbacteria bacterium]
MQRELDEYSLWLELPHQEYGVIRKIITEIAQEIKTPVFEPHITLLGGIPQNPTEIMAGMRQLAETQAFPLTLANFSLGENRYRCLIAECERTEVLMNFNTEAQELFGMKEGYRPHLSLMYGDATLETKVKLRDRLSQTKILPLCFAVGVLSLWHIKGAANKWKKISEVSLS